MQLLLRVEAPWIRQMKHFPEEVKLIEREQD